MEIILKRPWLVPLALAAFAGTALLVFWFAYGFGWTAPEHWRVETLGWAFGFVVYVGACGGAIWRAAVQ